MSTFRAVTATALLSALLIAPAIARAADEAPVEEQPLVAPPAVEELQPPAPTPPAAIQWNQMEAARAEIRDRAALLRQQSIANETQAESAQ